MISQRRWHAKHMSIDFNLSFCRFQGHVFENTCQVSNSFFVLVFSYLRIWAKIKLKHLIIFMSFRKINHFLFPICKIPVLILLLDAITDSHKIYFFNCHYNSSLFFIWYHVFQNCCFCRFDMIKIYKYLLPFLDYSHSCSVQKITAPFLK